MRTDIGDYSSNPTRRWRRLLSQSFGLYRALSLFALYGLWVIVIRFLSLSIITYLTASAETRLQDINDTFRSNEVSLMGLAALIFLILMKQLNPTHPAPWKDFFSREQIESEFLPGFLRGAAIGGGFIILFLLSGHYKYLGYYIQFFEAPFELGNTFLRMLILATFTYSESYLFQKMLSKNLKKDLQTLPSILVSAFLYCIIKSLQFELGFMQLITLFLVSIFISLDYEKTRNFSRTSGIWAGVLIALQPLASLPIFGNDFTGIILIKYQEQIPFFPVSFWTSGFQFFETPGWMERWITGGPGGPISSFLFQALLIFAILRNMIGNRNPI